MPINFDHGKKLFFLAFFFSLLKLEAQAPEEAFQNIGIGIKVSQNVNREKFHEYWEAKTGIGLYCEFPFYLGEIRVGGNFMPFGSKVYSTPRFNSIYFYLQWSTGISLSKKFKLGGGLNLGLFEMNFEEINESSPELEVEREFSTGITVFCDYKLSEKFSIQISADYLSVFTKKPINLLIIGGGAAYSFDSPAWLKEFLE